MTRISKLLVLLAATVSLSAAAFASPQPPITLAAMQPLYAVGAQGPGYGAQGPGYGGGIRLTCSSDNGKRNWCTGDTRGGVRMVRQISGSPCIEGQTWGTDRRGLWVDRGCRAEFVLSRGGPQRPPAQVVTCSSDNGKRNWCGINGRDVRLTRQISGSPCIQGQTWGTDRRGLWVDRGCRAEFRVR